jgi:ABC-type transport system involved in multi-copper enzyme maturation permease subunit
MVWVWIALMGLLFSTIAFGVVQVGTGGDSAIGGAKQHITSEFELTRLTAAFTMIINSFFTAVLFGMAVIRDHDSGMMPLLHSSKLRSFEYLFSKFLACCLTVTFVMSVTVLLAMFFMFVLAPPDQAELIGAFSVRNFVAPIIKFALPSLLFIGGLAFLLGTATRKPILVFAFPVMFLIIFGLFLNDWSPEWLPTWANDMLGMIDPYGLRWLNEVYFNVDRGAEFYNTQPVAFTPAFAASRLVMIGLGVGGLLIAAPVFRSRMLGRRQGPLSAIDQPNSRHIERSQASSRAAQLGVGSMAMTQTGGGLVSDTWNIFWYELKELRYSPSLYLFMPFILLEVIGTSLFREGAFGTPLLQTSGMLAENAMGVLAVLGCLLMMFYTVESQMRERIKKLAPIFYSTRAKSFAMLMGKSLANTAVCVCIMAAALIASLIILLVQGIVSIEAFPFAAYWLLILMPTFILWGSYVTCLVVLTRNRYTTYALAAATLVWTLYLNMSGEMSWLTNWMANGLATWSDISPFEMDITALWINRLFVLALATLFTYLAARLFWRRGIDPVQLSTRLKPKPILLFGLRVAPFLVLPILLGSVLWAKVNAGHQGDYVKDQEKKYWQQNISTWADTEPPSVSGVDVKLDIQPQTQALAVESIMRLTNDQEEPMREFALTAGLHWKNIVWHIGPTFKINDETPPIPTAESLEDYEPEARSGLYIFEFDPPIQPGESTTLSYSFEGHFPDGVSKNGGDASEFILPSGVVLHTFGNSFMPYPGFAQEIGLDPEDQPEAKVFKDDFYEEELKPLFGGGDQFHVRTTITGPKEFTFNAVGVKKDDTESDGQRTVVWESDSPVSFFNVVGGKWKVFKGETTEIYYNEKHEYNVDEISEAIEHARAHYSRWFAPYPWKQLRLNEFPNMSTYAQGFATNITFSEGIGFLTKDKPGADAPFMVAAHETAHQWWGNILVPGEGPGGNILSEGMAHFSTGLLFDEVKGLRARTSFFRLIEDTYANRRSVDSERPMIQTDGEKSGDQTVTYDKGGWVFWMLHNHMGRMDNLHGIQAFIAKYTNGTDDYPVLQDFVKDMRAFADDKEAYDEFTQQWFFDTVVPQYEFSEVEMKEVDSKWVITGSVKNVGTGKMPLEICAALNERFVDEISEDLNPEYQDSRTEVVLAADESVEFEITAEFKPDRVLVDPDVKVLQLRRKRAVHEF